MKHELFKTLNKKKNLLSTTCLDICM